ncbi:metallophosphoesterase family protein [Rubrobacter aplysinae]|uniref:metallophosphoesterase family protein n=1 Tax=Rubrobacter aplysinae TaxID=909625 RepID=UPI00389A95EA
MEPLLQGPGLESVTNGVEAVLSCGDLPFDYLEYLVTFIGVPLFYVRGNHDPRDDTGKHPGGCIPIGGRVEDFGGFSIAGLSGCMWYSGGSNQYTERQMSRASRSISRRLRISRSFGKGLPTVFVSHAAPRGIGDAGDLCHRGFGAFLDLTRRHNPELWVHGHVHLYGRHDNDDSHDLNLGSTRVVNAYGYRLLDL